MMVNLTRASKYFLERAGIADARRGPVSKSSVSINAVHSYPLSEPYPSQDARVAAQGNPPPDRPLTEPFVE
jgi:hypothetical protein